MDNKIKIIQVFHNNLVDFIDSLVEQFPTETDLILVKTFFQQFCSPGEIIKYFCKSLLSPEVKVMIDKQDETFFLKNDSLFSDIPNQQKVFHFKNLWKNSNTQQKQMMWAWIQKFKRIAEIYESS
jgi:hypothetical protein